MCRRSLHVSVAVGNPASSNALRISEVIKGPMRLAESNCAPSRPRNALCCAMVPSCPQLSTCSSCDHVYTCESVTAPNTDQHLMARARAMHGPCMGPRPALNDPYTGHARAMYGPQWVTLTHLLQEAE